MKKFIIVNVIFLMSIFSLLSKNEYKNKEFYNWYFSEKKGISFNNTDKVPMVINDSPIFDTFKEVSYNYCTISDSGGYLLFSTNGLKIWSKNNKIMQNGDRLIGFITPSPEHINDYHLSTNGLAAIQSPNMNNIYYVFVLLHYHYFNSNTHQGVLDSNYYLFYHIVDMSLNNGLGAVVKKNVFLEKCMSDNITAVKHKNGRDAWLITRDWKSNSYFTYLINNTGVTTNPVISKSSFRLTDFYSDGLNDWQSGMKISPNGKIIITHYFIVSGWQTYLEVSRFDSQNGKIYDSRIYNLLELSNFIKNPLTGLEFSPDNTKLYISSRHFTRDDPFSQDTSTLIQFEIDNNNKPVNPKVIDKSGSERDLKGNNNFIIRGMQLAPDGKIYTSYNSYGSINVIRNPNKLSLDCDFEKNIIDLNIKSSNLYLSHPPVVNKKLINLNNIDLCEGEDLTLKADLKDYLESSDTLIYYWTGPKGFNSTQEKPNIRNVKPDMTGYYKLEVIGDALYDSDSAYINVLPLPEYKLSPDKILNLCNGDSIYISVSTLNKSLKFKWSTGDTSAGITINKPGLKTLSIVNEFGCIKSDTFIVNSAPNTDVRIIGENVICKNDSTILTSSPNSDSYLYNWSTGEKSPSIIVKNAGIYKIIVINEFGCKDSAEIEVNAVDSAFASIEQSDKSCIDQDIILTAKPIGNGFKYRWSTGEKSSQIITKHSSSGIFKYWVVVERNGGCIDTAFKEVYVLPSPGPQITGNLYICPGSTDILSVSQDFKSYNWSSGEKTKEITITKPGTYTVTVTDTNGCEGTTSLDVKEYDVLLSGITDNNYGKVNIESSRTSTLLVKNGSNSGVEFLKVYSKNYPNIFNITTNPALPQTLKQGETIEITVSFKPNDTQIYQDSLIIETGYPCQNLFASYLTGEGIQSSISTTVWLPDTTAQTGTENYRLPLKAMLMQDTTLSNLSYNAEISFDASYFQPEGISKGKLEQNTIVSGDRVLKISGEIPSLSENETILTEISGLVLLGKPEPAILKIISFDLSNPEISISKKDGSLTVSGVCNQGFSNLVIADNLVFEIAENPVNDELTINITGKRSEGQIKLEIYNVLGECVMSARANGSSPLHINVSSLPSGIYFVRLGNWTGSFLKIE